MNDYIFRYKNFLLIERDSMTPADRERLEKELGLVVVEITPGRRCEIMTISVEESIN